MKKGLIVTVVMLAVCSFAAAGFADTKKGEKIDGAKQDWVIVSMDTSGSAGLETHAHAECEVKRLKQMQMKGC